MGPLNVPLRSKGLPSGVSFDSFRALQPLRVLVLLHSGAVGFGASGASLVLPTRRQEERVGEKNLGSSMSHRNMFPQVHYKDEPVQLAPGGLQCPAVGETTSPTLSVLVLHYGAYIHDGCELVPHPGVGDCTTGPRRRQLR